MKTTKIKISLSQDGLLPQETMEVATMQLPVFQKGLLKSLGFEKVSANTYVGVLPVFFHLIGKNQEIEFELGVAIPETRKKTVELFQEIVVARMDTGKVVEKSNKSIGRSAPISKKTKTENSKSSVTSSKKKQSPKDKKTPKAKAATNVKKPAKTKVKGKKQ